MKKLKLILLFTFYFLHASAQDRLFACSYNSPVVGKGNVDIEVWNTYSFGRKDYHYSVLRQYQFSKEKWVEVMPHMKQGVKLTDEEYILIYNYLLVMQENKSSK